MTDFRMRNSGVRRALASFLMALVLVGAVVVEMRRAQANPVFLPLIIGVLFSGLMGVGAGIEMYDGAPTAAGAVGAKALSVTIANPADNGAAEGVVRVPTTASADSAASIVAPTGAPSSVAATVTNQYCFTWLASGGGTRTLCGDGGTAEAACYAVGSTLFDGNRCYDPANYGGGVSGSASTVSTCPLWYTLNGSDCLLSNVRALVADGKQDLTRTGTTLAKIAGDDNGAVNAVLSQNYVSNDSADVSGISVSGQPRLVRTTALSSGGSEVKQITQKTDGAGNTYLEVRRYEIDSAGTVTGASSSSVSGGLAVTGSGASSTYAVTGSGTNYTPAAPGSSGGTSSGTSGFPSDYAKSGEAAAAAQTIASKLDEKLGNGADPTDPTQPADSQFDQAFFNGTFTNLLGWQLPGHTAQCPTTSFVFYGTTLVFDAHCAIIDQFSGVLATVATALWTILALLIVLGA